MNQSKAGILADFEIEVARCASVARFKTPEQQLAFACEMVRCWEAFGVRILEKLYAYPNPIPEGRFENLVIDTCNTTIRNILIHRDIRCERCNGLIGGEAGVNDAQKRQ